MVGIYAYKEKIMKPYKQVTFKTKIHENHYALSVAIDELIGNDTAFANEFVMDILGNTYTTLSLIMIALECVEDTELEVRGPLMRNFLYRKMADILVVAINHAAHADAGAAEEIVRLWKEEFLKPLM